MVADLDAESVFRSRLHDPRRRKALPWLGEKLSKAARIVIPSEPWTGSKPSLLLGRVERLDEIGEIYQALFPGTRDYVLKNGLEKGVIGLSGGIDSSLVATIAVDIYRG